MALHASHSSLSSEQEDFEIVSVASTSYHEPGSGMHYHHSSLPLPLQAPEPVPQQDALERYETACLSAEDIQAFTRRAIEGTHGYMINDAPKMRPVRIYMTSPYEALQPECVRPPARSFFFFATAILTFCIRHVLALRQAKLAFGFVHLIVGVATNLPDLLGVFDPVERAETLRHVRWVDEVVTAENITEAFLKENGIDYVVHEPNTPWNSGFDCAKQLGESCLSRDPRLS